MNDRPTIIGGLVIALVALTFPIWYSVGAGRPGPPPELELPADESQCVEDAASMRANHMELLDRWRDAVVREGRRTYRSTNLGEVEMSLTKTCLGCHRNRETFCLRCHEYANVGGEGPAGGVRCWACHLEPEGN